MLRVHKALTNFPHCPVFSTDLKKIYILHMTNMLYIPKVQTAPLSPVFVTLHLFPYVAITTSFTEKVVLLEVLRAEVSRIGSLQWKWQKDMLVMLIIWAFCCIRPEHPSVVTESRLVYSTNCDTNDIFGVILPTVAWKSSELREPRFVSVAQTPTDPVMLTWRCRLDEEKRWIFCDCVVWKC